MTIKSIKTYKGIPVKFSAKARGYWDYSEIKIFNEEQDYPLNMKPYDGLWSKNYESVESPCCVTIGTSRLPDGKYLASQTKCLMPEKEGMYYSIKSLVPDYYLINENVAINNGIASGFSQNSYLRINQKLPKNPPSCKMIFRITLPESFKKNEMVLGKNGTTYGLMISSSGYYNYYTGSRYTGTTKLTPGTSYWFAAVYNGTNFTGYILADDEAYTLDTLPDFEQWSQEWQTISCIFYENFLNIGYCNLSTGDFFAGMVDLNNSCIWLNDEKWWYYGQKTQIEQACKGILQNHSDTGEALQLNCFCQNGEYVLTDSADMENAHYLGSVSLPAHPLYSYSETSHEEIDNFIKSGSVSVNPESGIATGFGSSAYLDTQCSFLPPKQTPWRIRIRFSPQTRSGSNYLGGFGSLSATVAFVVVNNYLNCSVGNDTLAGTIVDTQTLTEGTYYVAELAYDGDTTYTLRVKSDGGDWRVAGTLESDSYIYTNTTFQLGRNQSSTNQYFSGNIDLSEDTWVEIGGVTQWKPQSTHYTGTWTAQA